jgi:methylmalonyl-CoA/ethylmalonyl-CoA epimerase
MITGIDHVAIVVEDLERAVETYRAILGMEPEKMEEVPEQGVAMACFRLPNGRIELMEPTDPESGVARFLRKRGEGMHHVCLRSDDLEADMARLVAGGLEAITPEPQKGVEGTIAFFHPRSTHGVLLELVHNPQGDDRTDAS